MVRSKEKGGKGHHQENQEKPHKPDPDSEGRKPVQEPERMPDAGNGETAKKLEEKERESAANYDRYLRAAADLENYKKRMAREHAELVKYGNEKLIRDLIPILDSLDRALKQTNDAPAEVQAFSDGLKLIEAQFMACLQKHGVERIEARGKDFDPNFHEAVMMIESEEFENNKVIEDFETGYLLNGRLLKPAKVSVSKRVVKNAEAADR
ncbi:MAG TPA: nucleotide exchange factor GrpE [Syntrophales bacterium]|nr:nucleotide exchange factor GrpE [Syntrophales bacterium]HPI58250.1 nucleotide exchange factor GrpE [Syntrophales bacterium]HPN25313.1 nucleotide exchange factor GrpE [Syntrophales bacterium]HQM29605.1 nucleotide exchange factor GrpE [Syntrophales bacterium]